MTKESKLHQHDRAFGSPILTIAHERIHRGEFFTASSQAAVGSGGDVEFLIRVAAGTSAHMRISGTVSSDMVGFFFEGPTSSVDGTPVLAVDRNRFTKNTATTLVFVGPTVSVDGTPLMEFDMPGGDKQTASGGEGSSFEEYVLEPGDYLMRIENNIIAPAAAGRAGIIVDFYEPLSGTEQVH